MAYREAWAAWWAANGAKVSLPDRQAVASLPRYLGYTLMVMQQLQAVVEYGSDGKERWRIGGLVNPQGQFLFVEGLCEMPIARTLADHLVALAHGHAVRRDAEVSLQRQRPELTAAG